ncbi:MAG: glycosyltransferase [Chloroflexales bacterium]
MKRATARLYLKQIVGCVGTGRGALLEVGCGHGELLLEALQFGFSVHGLDISPSAVAFANRSLGGDYVRCGIIETAELPEHFYDICVLSDLIEHTRDPVALMRRVHRLLKPGGLIFIATPSLDSWSARLLGSHWMEYKTEHLYYFSRSTIENLLARTGFVGVRVEASTKVLTPEYVYHHFQRFRVPLLSQLLAWSYRLLPTPLQQREVSVVASGMVVTARAGERRERPLLSIIIPAYNECETFGTLIENVLNKNLAGIDKEIIIIESNSQDGTRELALTYRDHPQIHLILEDRPRGKGHAVRTGLRHAQGDFVLIQDADLEYDINDYDILLEPLARYQQAFVLGSRHSGSWKLRHFTDQQMISGLMNIGHVLFMSALNLLYGQRLRDPFTMYKVFRRDCLHDLAFNANRFDFDFELVIKLLRKGYQPIEIPVSYNSRSFGEGKKVSMIYDPITWIWALIRFRLPPLYTKEPHQ